jgi:colicin import membrane protein
MDNQQKLTKALLLALALHLSLLLLFALSALFKPTPELAQPDADIIHATIVEASKTPTNNKSVEKAKPVTEQKQETPPSPVENEALKKAEQLKEKELAAAVLAKV